MAKVTPPLPRKLNLTAVPFVWVYDSIRSNLVRDVTPRVDAPHATDTFYAGLQLVMPEETAPAQRHTAFAMRYIIEGSGGFTAVHDRRIRMQKGDAILTPNWNYHDHGKDSSGPLIWLDGLDLPNFRHLPVHFVEHFNEPRYAAKGLNQTASQMIFTGGQLKAGLDEMEVDSATQR
ncbi:hypothetical protein N7460_006653 [Penicillium canescens]|uniref:Cupin type-2 domain-containing protein n=1 Tax=Penicillium canescens TaxID=5083 RepID=A0AAD6N884_PENCN|nr:hypothetical protein N7460_006653 [Penicillium canescens]